MMNNSNDNSFCFLGAIDVCHFTYINFKEGTVIPILQMRK